MYDITKMAEQIAQRRKDMNLTQEALAEMLGVTPQAISKWERGAGLPDTASLPDIASTLGLSLDQLFGLEQERNLATELFPAEYKGLRKVYATQNIACYSNLEVDKQTGVFLQFRNGSTANLGTQEIVFRGSGDILFLYPEDVQTENCQEIAPPPEQERQAASEYDGVDSLCIKVGGVLDVEIQESSEGIVRWGAVDLAALQEDLEVQRKDDTLIFRYKRKNINGFLDIFKAKSWQRNILRIELPMSLAARLEYEGSGAGNLTSTLDFEEAEISMAGSGDIRLGQVEKLEIEIAGAADCVVEKVAEAKIDLAGSADVKLEEVTRSLDIDMAGAGNIKIGRGQVESLALEMSGAGDLEANTLEVGTADIRLNGVCDVTIGHIRGQSKERVSRISTLRVLRRG